jgi:hypothetical protein
VRATPNICASDSWVRGDSGCRSLSCLINDQRAQRGSSRHKTRNLHRRARERWFKTMTDNASDGSFAADRVSVDRVPVSHRWGQAPCDEHRRHSVPVIAALHALMARSRHAGQRLPVGLMNSCAETISLASTPLMPAGRQQCDFRAKEGVTIENAVPPSGSSTTLSGTISALRSGDPYILSFTGSGVSRSAPRQRFSDALPAAAQQMTPARLAVGAFETADWCSHARKGPLKRHSIPPAARNTMDGDCRGLALH